MAKMPEVRYLQITTDLSELSPIVLFIGVLVFCCDATYMKQNECSCAKLDCKSDDPSILSFNIFKKIVR